MKNVAQQFISGIWAIMVGMSVTLRNVFRKKVTIHYGYAPRWLKQQTRPIAPRYRGRFMLLADEQSGELRCTACGICAQSCPGRCITVSGEQRKVSSYSIDLGSCLFCGLCVEACPFEALGMTQEPMPIQCERAAMLLEIEDLRQPAGSPAPGVTPSSVGGDVRPGKKPFAPKSSGTDAPETTMKGAVS